MEKNKQFEEWFFKYIKENFPQLDAPDKDACIEDFNSMPTGMQWGVYLEFFDSVGYQIQITPDWDYPKIGKGTGKLTFEYIIFKPEPPGEGLMGYESRQEAQIEAIKRAFEILNSK